MIKGPHQPSTAIHTSARYPQSSPRVKTGTILYFFSILTVICPSLICFDEVSLKKRPNQRTGKNKDDERTATQVGTDISNCHLTHAMGR